ncbi:MAG: helix-turn-helix transcriptional regulator, partial [Clostridia bacterium]|nr:helix-turn-helix transcriptional regulator [Clostridia bacterium]
SKKNYRNMKISPVRTVQVFEFDYILSCDPHAVSYINEKSCPLAPNILIIRKPGQKSNSRFHFKCYCLHLEIEKDHPIYNELFSTPEYFTLINDQTYQQLFETLFRHLIKRNKQDNDHFISAKLLELIYYIKRDEKRNKNARQHAFKRENQFIKEAILYIKQNFSQDISLKTLGTLTGYSQNHFQRIFTQIIGISPQKYLENVRIEQAKYLLTQNEKTLADIAYACGFSSQAYFIKVFKRHTLLTPSEFQKKSSFKSSIVR